MAFDDELKFESELVNLLFEKGWEHEVLKYPTEENLIKNWADILFKNNSGIDQLNDVPLSENEMQQLIDQIAKLRTPLALNQFINGKTVSIKRDNDSADIAHRGKEVSLKIYDRLEIKAGKSRYQIVEQPKFKCRDDIYPNRRGDLMLLINGMPVIHIELKKTGIPVSQATMQIQKYAREGVFTGLFSLIQVFVAMNPEETVYFANPGPDGKFNEDFFFHWADFNNEPMNDWKDIASKFLYIPMAHQMIGWYTVADKTDGILKVMRSYQYYASSGISDVVAKHDWDNSSVSTKGILGGYVWHTTGSGKTMTSYKTAQLIADSGLADKVVFLMDRIELGTQSLLQYKNFADETTDVQATDNTRQLVSKLKSDKTNEILIVTSIQKASNIAEDGPVTQKDLDKINSKRTVFIIDECHRSTFGNMLRDIKKTFTRAIFFGFTGTPIHDENSKKMNTTSSLFGNEIHRYSIADGIRDGNVLGFDPIKICTYKDRDLRQAIALEKAKAKDIAEAMSDDAKKTVFNKFMDSSLVPMAGYTDEAGNYIKGIEDYIPVSQYDCDEHRANVVDNILENWTVLSQNNKYHAVFATSSIPEAIEYYRLFKTHSKQLKFTALFDPSDNNAPGTIDKIDGIKEILIDYNKTYSKDFKIATYADFKTDIQMRLAHKDIYKGIENKNDQQLNLLIVVDQMLTGYDSKWINTLYMDKVMYYEGLIQAFSRTNRLSGNDKRHGTICYYRKPHTMEKNIEAAFRLYSGDKPFGIFVYKVERNVAEMNRIADSIKQIFKDNKIENFESLPASKEDRQKFAKLFNEYNKYLDAAKIQGFEFDKPLPHRTEEVDTGKKTSDGTPIIEEQVIVPVPSEANLSGQNYNALLQRYKDLAGKNSGGNSSGGDDVPYDIKGYITEINTGLIDTAYMNSKFVKFLKVLDSDKEEQIQEVLAELYKTFGTLSNEEQKYANVFIHQVQSGDVKADPTKTLRDYITEYMVSDRTKRITDFANSFGLASQDLLDFMKLDISELNIDDFGRFSALKEKVNREIAKSYIEQKEGKEISAFKLSMKIDSVLRTFVLSDGKE
ncbi:MAG: HsdR family type I site-specific deoxyribonuclease [Treponema sp.]